MKLGEVIHDSIIENKEKTKNYWEQLMLAAGSNNLPSSSEVKRPNGFSFLSIPEPVTKLVDSDITKSPKIIETVAKYPSAHTPQSKIEDNGRRKRESVIEIEIQMQKEREAAFAQERQQVSEKTHENGREDVKVPFDIDESLNLSIPTTDEGNYPESGSDDKDHSFDETRLVGLSPEVNVMRSSLHHRTQSLDSMSSGHSSGSIGSFSSGGAFADSVLVVVRRRPVTVKPLDQPQEENLLEIVRSDKETPIEKEIRLSKEREDELRRKKELLSTSDVLSKRRSNSLTVETSPVVTVSTTSKHDSVAFARGCVKKVINRNRTGYIVKQQESPNNLTKDAPVDNIGCNHFEANGRKSAAKLFAPSNCSRQKGLMKRFIASGGKLNATFTFSSSPTVFKTNDKNSNAVPCDLAPPKVYQWKSSNDNKEVTSLVGTRPGYVSVEDKIHVELQEMRKREKELKEQRARTFIRSQPDLLHVDEEEEDVDNNQKEVSKLRSALSNPNLFDRNESTKEIMPERKRNALIDVWEDIIQKS